MKILLIKPPIRGFLLEIGRHYPIGLAYLAGALRSAGHDVMVFDALAHTDENYVVPPAEYTARDCLKLARHPRWSQLLHWGSRRETIAGVIRDVRPDVVGISCMFSPFYETAYEVAYLAREILPDGLILFGGQHPTVAPAKTLRECNAVDVAVLGEAEETLPALLARVALAQGLRGQEGVAFRCDGRFCNCAPGSVPFHIEPRKSWADIEQLPTPATDIVEFAPYGNVVTLITSRGCPFSCTFCTVHAMVGRRFRTRSPRQVVDEITHYVTAYGVTDFAIEDDNFTFSIPRVIEICEEIIARGLKIRLSLPNGMTVVRLTESLAALMARAGFRDLFLGLESTDPARLKEIEKGFTSLNRVGDGHRWFVERGVDVAASLIVGLPHQSAAEIARDVANLLQRGIRFWSNPFYPIPGSPDYETCLHEGVIDEQTDFVLFDQFNFAIPTSCFTARELYDVWVLTQTIAHWPGYIFESFTVGSMNSLGLAVTKLVEHATSRRTNGTLTERLECPAEPFDWFEADGACHVVVRADTCFAALNQVPSEGVPQELNQFTADVIAAALSLYTRRWCEAKVVPMPPPLDASIGLAVVISPSVTPHPIFDEFVTAFAKALETEESVLD